MEYRFSMERKDRVTDWSIGILFVSLVAYAELLRGQTPSIWRIYLLVVLLCFIVRLFSNSCLAYAYLKKWRYLQDLIERHWMNKESLKTVTEAIRKYHYTPRATHKRAYFVRCQLQAGFLILFFFPFCLLLFEIYSHLHDLNIVAPILILVIYCIYESVIFVRNEDLNMPSENTTPPDSDDG